MIFCAASNRLNNMSTPHRSAIQFNAHPEARRCRSLIFRWLRTKQESRPRAVLAAMDEEAWKGTAKAAEAELRRRINQHAETLPWPGALLVTQQAAVEDTDCDDLLTVCTVLTKSSNSVYLRDKEPNFDRLQKALRVVLQIPHNWSPR